MKGTKGLWDDALILFVSLPDDDGRRPTYSACTQPSSSDCSSFSASGDDDMTAAARTERKCHPERCKRVELCTWGP